MVLKFYDFINEVRRDLQFSYLKKLMTDLGYDYAFTNPDHKFYKTVIDRDGNPHRLLLVTHKHHTGGTVDAAAFTQMKKNLIDEYQYTGNIDLFNKVDWDYIGTVNPLKSGMLGDIDMETGLDKATAESLKDIEVGDQLFKNVWVITNRTRMVNIIFVNPRKTRDHCWTDGILCTRHQRNLEERCVLDMLSMIWMPLILETICLRLRRMEPLEIHTGLIM